MSLQHLESIKRHADRRDEAHAAPAPAVNHDETLRGFQHALGNRSFGRLVHAAVGGGSTDLGAASPALKNEGEPLPPPVRSHFETLFGHDLGDVRVHTEGAAAQSVTALGARAYALDSHVVFAPGQFAPQTGAGRRLLAHELAHVVQQRQPGGDAGGGDSERRAEAAAADAAAGMRVSPQSLGSTPLGLHADSGLTMLPAVKGRQPQTYSFKLPPLKISRWVFSYLLTNNLLTPAINDMLLSGELVVDWNESGPTPASGDAGAAQTGIKLWADLDPLRKRLLDIGAKPLPEPSQVAPEGGAKKKPKPEPSPPFFKWKGLVGGLDLNVPYFHPNVSFSGLTVDLLKKGEFDLKGVVGFTGSVEVQATYRNWHLVGSVDREGKWEMRLSYPNDAPVPDFSMMGSIFSQGERALREALVTVKDPPSLGRMKDKFGALAEPIKNAADAGKGVAKVQGGVNISLVLSTETEPGKLPESVLSGTPQPAGTPKQVYGGLTVTFIY